VTVSRVKSSDDLCVLLQDDMDNFTIHPTVNLDVVEILSTMQSSRPLPIPKISPGDDVESGIASIRPSDVRHSSSRPARWSGETCDTNVQAADGKVPPAAQIFRSER
jgi:hypothetical protein